MILDFENKVPFADMQQIYNFVYNSTYKLGWADREDEKFVPNIHSNWSLEDVEKSGLLEHLKKLDDTLKYNIEKNFHKCIVNLSKSGDYNFCHTHKDQTVILYYVNLDWQDGWGGETIFYNETMSEASKTVLYKPNRAILFDGNTPHSIRPSSHIAPQYRFTLGIFFQQPNFIEEAKNNT